MSIQDKDRFSTKLQTLLNYSLELKCHNLINWNLYKEQTNVLEKFFKDQFNKENNSQHEITKNIFKDFILRSNSDFSKEIWKNSLEKSPLGKQYHDEITRQFMTKELLLKTIFSSKDLSKSFQPCEKEYKNKKSNTIKIASNMIDQHIPSYKQLNEIPYESCNMDDDLIFDNNNNVTEITLPRKLTINEQNTSDKQDTNTKQRKTHSSYSLPHSNELYFHDKEYETINELPDIEINTKLITALSNEKNANQAKQIKNQAKMKQDPFKDETEKENENIIYQSSPNKSIFYISINLFLKKIAKEDFAKQNPLLTQGFIEQYSAFITLDNFINKIISAFNYYNTKENKTFSNLISFLNQLITLEFLQSSQNTFFIPNKTFKTVLQFYKELSSSETITSLPNTNIKEIYTSLKKLDKPSLINKSLQKRKSIQQNAIYNNKKVLIQESSDNKFFYMFFYDPWDLANELTRITFDLFSRINIKELLKGIFSKSKKKETSPNVVNCIERFDKLVYFIIEDIISYDRKRFRAQLMEKWINTAWECKRLGNFNDCMIINTVFCNYLVRNLKKTWERVGQDTLKKLNEIKKICSFQNVYSNIKAATSERINAKLQFIPYLGLLLKEISSLEEKYQYVKDDVLINCMKIEKVQIAMNTFFAFRKCPYVIKEREELKILEYLSPKTQEELEEVANDLEPKFSLSKKNRYGKRQTRTDKFYYENKLEEGSGLGIGKIKQMNNY